MPFVKLQERVVSLISKGCQQRGERDIDMVLPWLRKKSELLQGLNTVVLKDVIRNCSYRHSTVDDVLIRQGDKGDSFFIMLSGRTSVYIDTIRSDDDDPYHLSPVKDEDVGQDVILGTQGKRRKPLDRTTYGKFIMHFDAGKSFGEIALISEDAVRNATIITDYETDLLVISRDLFNRSVKAKQEEEYRERRSFVDTYPLFSNWSPRLRRLCEMSLRKETHPYGSVIATQGHPSTGLIFIMSGQAKLVMEPAKHVTQYAKIMRPQNAAIYKQYKTINADGSVSKESVTSDHIRVRRKEGYAAAERRVMSRYVNVCCVEENEIVGDIEMGLELDTNIGTLISTGNTDVFILNGKNYERLVQKKNPHTAETLKVEAYRKVCGRLCTTTGAQIPLLKKLQGVLKDMLPHPELYLRRGEHYHRSKELIHLIDMFLQDRSPLIQPLLPDALYYKQRSAEKAKKIVANASRFQRSSDPREKRTKMPRSLDKLRNNIEAENELLGYRPLSTASVAVGDGGVLRPLSSALTPSGGKGSPSVRPPTAADSVTVTRCDFEYEFGQGSRKEEAPNRDLVVGIYEEMEQFQKDKKEERSRVICSGVRKKNENKRPEMECDEEEYFDWETSDSNLCVLENRIKTFCDEGTQSLSRDRNRVAELRRFEIERPQYVPIPGGSVFVHRRPCQYPVNTPVNPALHQHVRRFMLSRRRHHIGTDTVCFSDSRPLSSRLRAGF
ncbi:uncharacterized protein [Haliotis cracherodii]|uniref:uncharacterized protein n=1 Tax=Haliotis cracherodii TaxID=6455 RepID=UPI0039ED810D